jgi:hypothetical protein
MSRDNQDKRAPKSNNFDEGASPYRCESVEVTAPLHTAQQKEVSAFHEMLFASTLPEDRCISSSGDERGTEVLQKS